MVRQHGDHLPVITIGCVKLGVSVQCRLGRHTQRRYGSLNVVVVTMGSITLGVVLVVRGVVSGTLMLDLGGSTVLPTPYRKRKCTHSGHRNVFGLLLGTIVRQRGGTTPCGAFPRDLQRATYRVTRTTQDRGQRYLTHCVWCFRLGSPRSGVCGQWALFTTLGGCTLTSVGQVVLHTKRIFVEHCHGTLINGNMIREETKNRGTTLARGQVFSRHTLFRSCTTRGCKIFGLAICCATIYSRQVFGT